MKHTILTLLMLTTGCGTQGSPIRIAVVGNGFGNAVPVLARDLGFYRQEGVEAAIDYLPSNAKTMEALLAGSVEFATGGFDQLVQLAVSGKALRSVVLIINRDSRSLAVSPPNLTILAETFTPEGHKSVWGADSIPFLLLAARGDWIEQNRGQARRVAKAVQRTMLWLRVHSAEEIRAALQPEFVSRDAEVDLEVLRIVKTVYSPDGIMPPQGPEILRKALALTQENVRGANIDLSKLYTNEFVAEKP